MIEPHERQRMLRAYSIGPTMIAYLDEAGLLKLRAMFEAARQRLAAP